MMKWVDKIVFVISIPAVVLLLGAYSSRYVNPNLFVWPSLLGLAYPYLLIGNLLLALYWVARWKKTALIFVAVFLLGIPTFMGYYGTNRTLSDRSEGDLSVLSYNVRYFDKYGWTKDKTTYSKLLAYINRFAGSVVCLQEFPTDTYTRKPEAIVKGLPVYPYHYSQKELAVFSRLPIVNRGTLPFDKKYTGSCIYCDVVYKRDTIRIYNVHLESYKFGSKERKFVRDISQGNTNDLSGEMKNILSRIAIANKNRALQARQIKKHVENSPHPVILCGDFNDTPLSYTYRIMGQGLKDSFIEKGRGLGNTYIGEFPSFRIDYIFHSGAYTTVAYSRQEVALSDHYPITCRIKVTGSEPKNQ